MYKHILIPTDGSERSDRAVVEGIAFAKSIGAGVTILIASPSYHAIPLDPVMLVDTPDQYRRDCQAWADRHLGQARAWAEGAGVPCELLHVESDQPYRAIIDAAAHRGCDLIAMASHGRHGVAGLLLGSETTKVLTHTAIPVLVYR